MVTPDIDLGRVMMVMSKMTLAVRAAALGVPRLPDLV
jgi:hypothetical protein